MPRRASSGINIGQVAGIAAAVLGFVVIAALLVKLIAGGLFGDGGKGSSRKPSGGSSGDAAPLNLLTYRDNGNSLRGNVYRVEGKVEETLRWTPDRGRLISFEAKDATETMPLPVLVPEDFSNLNIERGTELGMVVRVDRDGTLVAESIDE